MKRFFNTIILSIISAGYGWAQSEATEEPARQAVSMADQMREEGKIYVVVAVVVILFLGFMIYLLRTDKKIKHLEREVEQLSGSGKNERV